MRVIAAVILGVGACLSTLGYHYSTDPAHTSPLGACMAEHYARTGYGR